MKLQASRRLIPSMLTPSISRISSPGRTLSTGPPGRTSEKRVTQDPFMERLAAILTNVIVFSFKYKQGQAMLDTWTSVRF